MEMLSTLIVYTTHHIVHVLHLWPCIAGMWKVAAWLARIGQAGLCRRSSEATERIYDACEHVDRKEDPYRNGYVHNDQTFYEKYWNDPVCFRSCSASTQRSCCLLRCHGCRACIVETQAWLMR